MPKLLAAVLLLLPAISRADDGVSARVQQDYIDPILGQIGNAARTGAAPNDMELMPAMTPQAREAVRYAQTKLIDPLTEASQNTASQAARVLGSADTSAAAAPALQDHIFDLPNQMALQITQMIQEMMTGKQALSAPAEPLTAENLPPNLRRAVAPVAKPKDFAYRKDSTKMVRGRSAPRNRGLKPFN
jgi:hypothetical protein